MAGPFLVNPGQSVARRTPHNQGPTFSPFLTPYDVEIFLWGCRFLRNVATGFAARNGGSDPEGHNEGEMHFPGTFENGKMSWFATICS